MIQLESGLAAERIDPIENPVLGVFMSMLRCAFKGAIVGLQWALYMHGFDPDAPDEVELAKAEPIG